MVYPNVLALDDQRIATPNLAPGVRVYDEDLFSIDGQEYRSWNPMKSKLGSYIVKGGRNFPLEANSRVLYLGAANGTTPSHVSDIVRDGLLVAVEFSPRSYRDLLGVAKSRPNMLPLLADAWRPELYERYIGKVDLVFQDIAQRQQAAIFVKNIERFRPPWGILAVKARSVDVAADPRKVYEDVAAEVERISSYQVVETVDLGPFERDHAALVVRPREGGPRARQDVRAETRDAPRRDERPRDDRPPQRQWQPRGPPPGGPGRGAPREERPRFDRSQKPERKPFDQGERSDRRGWR